MAGVKKKKSNAIEKMQSPAAFADYGTEDGYGATEADQARPHARVKIEVAAKPAPGKALRKKVTGQIEAAARKKNRKKY